MVYITDHSCWAEITISNNIDIQLLGAHIQINGYTNTLQITILSYFIDATQTLCPHQLNDCLLLHFQPVPIFLGFQNLTTVAMTILKTFLLEEVRL